MTSRRRGHVGCESAQQSAADRAEMRVLVKRTLRKYDYPPDKQQRATDTVIQQAELLGEALTE